MKITVAIITNNNGQEFEDCLDAITQQRIIKPDRIRIYDFGSTDNTIQYAEQFNAEIRPLKDIDLKDDSNVLSVFKYIVEDNQDTDILVHLAPFVIIDRSAISEMFRYFLKFEDLALVYGRQMSKFDASLLTKFYYRYYYPISKRDMPLWHLYKVYCSFKMIAFRMKYLQIPGIIPDRDFYDYGDIYIAARFSQKGYRIMYNPFSYCTNPRAVTIKELYFRVKYLYMFLSENPWITERWNIRKSEIAFFCEDMRTYFSEYSIIPLYSFYSCIIYFILLHAKKSALNEKKRLTMQLEHPESKS